MDLKLKESRDFHIRIGFTAGRVMYHAIILKTVNELGRVSKNNVFLLLQKLDIKYKLYSVNFILKLMNKHGYVKIVKEENKRIFVYSTKKGALLEKNVIKEVDHIVKLSSYTKLTKKELMKL